MFVFHHFLAFTWSLAPCLSWIGLFGKWMANVKSIKICLEDFNLSIIRYVLHRIISVPDPLQLRTTRNIFFPYCRGCAPLLTDCDSLFLYSASRCPEFRYAMPQCIRIQRSAMSTWCVIFVSWPFCKHSSSQRNMGANGLPTTPELRGWFSSTAVC